jgi:hypothetical protein
MQTFRVTKELHGWAVRLDPGMCTPFWSEALATREAERLCRSLRAHGVAAEVVVQAERRTVAAEGSQAQDRWREAAWR